MKGRRYWLYGLGLVLGLFITWSIAIDPTGNVLVLLPPHTNNQDAVHLGDTPNSEWNPCAPASPQGQCWETAFEVPGPFAGCRWSLAIDHSGNGGTSAEVFLDENFIGLLDEDSVPGRCEFATTVISDLRLSLGSHVVRVCSTEQPFGSPPRFELDDFIFHNVRLVCKERAVPVDIKPGSCPNPLNPKSKGVLPVAIVGTPDLDVGAIVPETVRLSGVAPIRWSVEDTATPRGIDPPISCQDCTTERGDGLSDLNLKFRTQDVVAVLGDRRRNQCLSLELTGELIDGTLIRGEDTVLIRAVNWITVGKKRE